jgi:hypothetical protein
VNEKRPVYYLKVEKAKKFKRKSRGKQRCCCLVPSFQTNRKVMRMKLLKLSLLPFFIFFTVQGATPNDIQKIREAIKKATSLQEVERLTRLLQSGQISSDFYSNGNLFVCSTVWIDYNSFIF